MYSPVMKRSSHLIEQFHVYMKCNLPPIGNCGTNNGENIFHSITLSSIQKKNLVFGFKFNLEMTDSLTIFL